MPVRCPEVFSPHMIRVWGMLEFNTKFLRLESHIRYIRITLVKGFRHRGHLVTDEAHLAHATTWPHGENAVLYSLT